MNGYNPEEFKEMTPILEFDKLTSTDIRRIVHMLTYVFDNKRCLYHYINSEAPEFTIQNIPEQDNYCFTVQLKQQ